MRIYRTGKWGRDGVAALDSHYARKLGRQGTRLYAMLTCCNRYQHLLQMYGEKAEEAQELQFDLDDIKGVLKSQTQQFLQQIDDLKAAARR